MSVIQTGRKNSLRQTSNDCRVMARDFISINNGTPYSRAKAFHTLNPDREIDGRVRDESLNPIQNNCYRRVAFFFQMSQSSKSYLSICRDYPDLTKEGYSSFQIDSVQPASQTKSPQYLATMILAAKCQSSWPVKAETKQQPISPAA